MMRFEATLAVRHLRSGGWQTALTVSTVATGVIVIVFISSLVFGLRSHVSDLLTDLLPNVTVVLRDHEPVPLANLGRDKQPLSASRIEHGSQQRKDIDNWQRAEQNLRAIPGVRVVAPAIVDSGFVSHGAKRLGAIIYGADPDKLDRVTQVRKYIIAGRYAGLNANEVVINLKLARDLGVNLGDRVRLTSAMEKSTSFQISGIYDTGNDEDMNKAYITLRAAQSLYGTGTAVRSLLIKADSLFQADVVADRIMTVTEYEAKSWSRQYPQFSSSLGVYNAVAYLVSGFSLVAAGFAIASVLIVSVLQKSKQIGILKSIGAKSRQILIVFLLEGLLIAIVGSGLGTALGTGVVLGLGIFKQPVTRLGAVPERLFPAQLSWQLLCAAVSAAILATVIAAVLPARRAAKLNPVQAMR